MSQSLEEFKILCITNALSHFLKTRGLDLTTRDFNSLRALQELIDVSFPKHQKLNIQDKTIYLRLGHSQYFIPKKEDRTIVKTPIFVFEPEKKELEHIFQFDIKKQFQDIQEIDKNIIYLKTLRAGIWNIVGNEKSLLGSNSRTYNFALETSNLELNKMFLTEIKNNEIKELINDIYSLVNGTLQISVLI